MSVAKLTPIRKVGFCLAILASGSVTTVIALIVAFVGLSEAGPAYSFRNSDLFCSIYFIGLIGGAFYYIALPFSMWIVRNDNDQA